MGGGRARKRVGGKVRPTTQKILGSLSSILRPRLEGAKVLDMFAGSGRVGLRILEEGAEHVIFVEAHRKVAQDLREIIRESPFKEHCSLVIGPVPKTLFKIKGTYDLLLCDPPYDWKEPKTLLPSSRHLCEIGGLLVVEHHHKTPYEATEGWLLQRQEKFGETRLSFFERVSKTEGHEPS